MREAPRHGARTVYSGGLTALLLACGREAPRHGARRVNSGGLTALLLACGWQHQYRLLTSQPSAAAPTAALNLSSTLTGALDEEYSSTHLPRHN